MKKGWQIQSLLNDMLITKTKSCIAAKE